jgi:hypothetical protein
VLPFYDVSLFIQCSGISVLHDDRINHHQNRDFPVTLHSVATYCVALILRFQDSLGLTSVGPLSQWFQDCLGLKPSQCGDAQPPLHRAWVGRWLCFLHIPSSNPEYRHSLLLRRRLSCPPSPRRCAFPLIVLGASLPCSFAPGTGPAPSSPPASASAEARQNDGCNLEAMIFPLSGAARIEEVAVQRHDGPWADDSYGPPCSRTP